MKLSLPHLHTVRAAKQMPLHPLPVVYRQWRWLMLSLFVCLVAVIGLSAFVLWKVQYGETSATDAEITVRPRTINRGRIEFLQNEFQAREDAFTKLQTERPVRIDPAL